jgi:hypothetical protein
MKISFLLILILLYVSAFSQTVKSIDKLIYRVDNTKFSDSITILDSANRTKTPVKITGYLSGDTLLKSVTRFKQSARVRLTYYKNDRSVYVKEFDSTTNEMLTEVYGFGFTVYKSKVLKPLDTEEKKEPYRLLESSDYSTVIGFAVVDRKAKKYHFKVKLTDALPLPAGCGVFAFGHLQKFEVLSTDFPNYDKKFVLIIEPCPEFLGDKFFQDGEVYDVDVATNSGVTFGYAINNNYEAENLPTFWSRKIVKTD